MSGKPKDHSKDPVVVKEKVKVKQKAIEYDLTFSPSRTLQRSPTTPVPLIDIGSPEKCQQKGLQSTLPTSLVVADPCQNDTGLLDADVTESENKENDTDKEKERNANKDKVKEQKNTNVKRSAKTRKSRESSSSSSEQTESDEEEEGEDVDDQAQILANVTGIQQTTEAFFALRYTLTSIAKGRKSITKKQEETILCELEQCINLVTSLQLNYAKLKGAYAEQRKTVELLKSERLKETKNIITHLTETINTGINTVQENVQQTIKEHVIQVPQATSYTHVATQKLQNTGNLTHSNVMLPQPNRLSETTNSNKRTLLLYKESKSSQELQNLIRAKVDTSKHSLNIKRVSKIANDDLLSYMLS